MRKFPLSTVNNFLSLKMIWLILILGLILRLITINQSLWLDEAINVNAAQTLTFWHYVTGYPIGDFHPPGYFAILWVFSHLFGFSELAVRFPSIVFGVGAIYFTYLIGKDFFNRKVGLLASLFLAIAPLHVYYSQEARMYSMATFFATVSFYFFFAILEKRKSSLIGYVLGIIGLLYSDYLVYFIIPVQFLSALILFRKQFLQVFIGQVIGLLFLSPWLTIFPQQLMGGRQTAENVPGWKKVVGGGSLKNLGLVFIKTIIGRVSFTDKSLYLVVMTPVSFLYGLIAGFSLKKLNKQTIVIISWVIIPLAIAFTVSFYIPILSYFRMLFILPGIYLVLAIGIYNLPKLYAKMAVILIITVSLLSLIVYYTNPKFQREDWKGLVRFTNSLESNALVLFEDSQPPAPFIYHDNGQQYTLDERVSQKVSGDFGRGTILKMAGIKNFPAKSQADLNNIEELTDGKQNVYLIDYLVEISDSDRYIDKELVSLGYKVVDVYDFSGVGLVYEYSK